MPDIGKDQPKIRVIGDRQHGKSELLMAACAKWTEMGQHVVYLCGSWEEAYTRMHALVDYECPNVVFCWGRGRFSMTHEVTGGTFRFFSSRSERLQLDPAVDILVIDDVQNPHLDSEWRFPNARVYRTYL